ncbi:MAG TPA: type II toxin-antitoxin system RelE/ParE family toxin [Candidatus Kapabacteria bacterium]
MRVVEFYRTETGGNPVEDFLVSLPSKVRQKAVWVLKAIEQLQRVSTQYLKKLDGTDDIWEIRIIHAKDSIRLLCFWSGENIIIVTHGFKKKTDKVPQREIQLATERKKEFERRKSNG